MDHCDSFIDLLSQSLDGPLAPKEQQALQHHLEQCPECRLLSQQFLEIQSEFHTWEEQEVPAGFTEGVMTRIRAEESKPKIIPIWKHPQFKMLGSVAACAVICLGLWRTGAPQATEDAMLSPAVSAPAAENFTAIPYAASGTTADLQAAQAPVETAIPSPASLSKGADAAPAQDAASYSLMVHSESAPLPTEDQLLQLVQDTLGQAPGTLLLVDVLPEISEGELHTAVDGSQLLVLHTQPEANMWKTLREKAYFRLDLGDGPIVFMTTT